MNLVSEAHLHPSCRSVAIVRYMHGKRRSWRAWAIFIGFMVLNETRGTYAVAEFLAQFIKAYHGA